MWLESAIAQRKWDPPREAGSWPRGNSPEPVATENRSSIAGTRVRQASCRQAERDKPLEDGWDGDSRAHLHAFLVPRATRPTPVDTDSGADRQQGLGFPVTSQEPEIHPDKDNRIPVPLPCTSPKVSNAFSQGPATVVSCLGPVLSGLWAFQRAFESGAEQQSFCS